MTGLAKSIIRGVTRRLQDVVKAQTTTQLAQTVYSSVGWSHPQYAFLLEYKLYKDINAWPT